MKNIGKIELQKPTYEKKKQIKRKDILPAKDKVYELRLHGIMLL